MTSGGNNYFPKNKLVKFSAI